MLTYMVVSLVSGEEVCTDMRLCGAAGAGTSHVYSKVREGLMRLCRESHVGTKPASGMSRSHLPLSSTKESHPKTSNSIVCTTGQSSITSGVTLSALPVSAISSSTSLRTKT